MSSRPRTTMIEETTNNNRVTGGEEFSDVPPEEEAVAEMSEDGFDQEPEPEPEGLTFYHMDLYDTSDRLEIFPEDQFIKVERDGNGAEVSESDAAGETWASKEEQAEYELQKEVEELARLYGIGESMAREGDFLEFCAPIIEAVPSEQPAEQKNNPKTEEADGQMKVCDEVESAFVEPNHQKVNEETYHEEPSTRESHIEGQCDEEPLQKKPSGEEPGIKEPNRDDAVNEELPSEENQKSKLACDDLQGQKPYNEESQIKEPPKEELQSEENSKGQPLSEEESCSEEPQSEKANNRGAQREEPHDEERQSEKPNMGEPQSEKPRNGEHHVEELHTATEEPDAEKSYGKELLTEELRTEEPYIGEPHTEELRTEEPYVKEPHTEELRTEEPYIKEPHTEELRTKEPCIEDPQTEEHRTEEPYVKEPHTEEHRTEEPCAEEPHTEELRTEEPCAEEPHPEELRTEEPCTGEPHTEELRSEEPYIAEPPTEELCTEEPCKEEPQTEDGHSEEPCMEETVNIDINRHDAVNEDVQDKHLSSTPEQKADLRADISQTLEHGEELQPADLFERKTADEEIPDIFCTTCKTPIRAFEKLFGIHKDHVVAKLPSAVEDIKDEIHKNMCRLEEQIAQMENYAGHLEEIFITVEENFGRQEQNFDMPFTEIMQTLTQRYDEKAQALEEEKKQKLETLYGQLVDCGKSLDTSKDLMETIQELFKSKDKVDFVKTAVDTVDRLEEFLKAEVDNQVLTYPDYENKAIDFSEVQQLLDTINTLPAPSAPVINPQTPNSATGTSVKVCWSLFSDDTVERYHLYYKPVSDDTPNEDQAEFVVNVKETYCTVENLVPNTQYEFWVTALNTTGVGPASERAVYVTAPSPPVIKYKQCRNCEKAALVCWESGENVNPVDSYTVEICNVEDEDRGQGIAESIVGIPSCQSLVPLKPGETYNIYVRAVNVGGPSERSTPVSVLTTGTFFHLDYTTAHPLLSILNGGLTVLCEEVENLGDLPYHYNSFTRCIAVMGNLIPVKGKHYWEVDVQENTEYRIGVAFEDTNRNGYIGANNTSWCMRHVITPSRHKYEFLHCGATPDVRITIPPQIIGILLDYDNWKLSFFNMEPFQHLHTFSCHFQHMVHPCFALEKPGILRIRNGISIPQCISSC